MMGLLQEKEFEVLAALERAKKPLTQRETAEKCGISRSYVSRIEKRALEKLEDALGGKRE